jgi:predicted amidohydrolase
MSTLGCHQNTDNMLIGLLQFTSWTGQTVDNLNTADAVLLANAKAKLKDLAILVLPELAFSGKFCRQSPIALHPPSR